MFTAITFPHNLANCPKVKKCTRKTIGNEKNTLRKSKHRIYDAEKITRSSGSREMPI